MEAVTIYAQKGARQTFFSGFLGFDRQLAGDYQN